MGGRRVAFYVPTRCNLSVCKGGTHGVRFSDSNFILLTFPPALRWQGTGHSIAPHVGFRNDANQRIFTSTDKHKYILLY